MWSRGGLFADGFCHGTLVEGVQMRVICSVENPGVVSSVDLGEIVSVVYVGL